MKSRRRQMKYSLKTLCLATVVVSVPFAFYKFQLRSIGQHYDAIRQIKLMGGQPCLMTPSVDIKGNLTDVNNLILDHTKERFLDVVFGRPALVLAQVDLTNPDLKEDVLRSMVPHMQKIILLPISEEFEGPLLVTEGNGGFTPDLVEKIRSQLPGFILGGPEHLPNSNQHPVRIGMTTKQVEQAVAPEMFDQRTTDWVGDPALIPDFLKLLASVHKTYQNADGTVTWTYAADDIGVRMLVIDFDDNRRVAKISFSHGIPNRLRVRWQKKMQEPTPDVMFEKD